MTEQREFYAASVEAAVAKAAERLGVEESALSYRVVDEGNTGFLGIGARDARIEVDAPSGAATDAPDVQDSTPVEPATVVDDTDRDQAADIDGRPTIAEVARDPDEEEPESVPQDAVDETEGRIVALLDAMGFDARVDVYDAGGYVAVDVAPDNTALFIGQKGETIDALQYLVNAGVNKTREPRIRVVLDAEGYRQRRVEALQGMAHRTARKALREDRSVELPPMNPAERRVVHLFLRDNPRVTTESEGTGDARRVRVSPT
jgi:spoIIIJ-associated protein